MLKPGDRVRFVPEGIVEIVHSDSRTILVSWRGLGEFWHPAKVLERIEDAPPQEEKTQCPKN